MRRRFALTLVLLAGVLPASAQQRIPAPGDEVRVVAPAIHNGPMRGELVRYMGDTLAVHDRATDSVFVMPMHAIRRLALNTGPHRGRSVRRGGTIGAFIGAAVGLVAGPLIASSRGDDSGFLRITAISGLTGLAAGGGLGVAGGALLSGDQWQRYSMGRPDPCQLRPCPGPIQTATTGAQR